MAFRSFVRLVILLTAVGYPIWLTARPNEARRWIHDTESPSWLLILLLLSQSSSNQSTGSIGISAVSRQTTTWIRMRLPWSFQMPAWPKWDLPGKTPKSSLVLLPATRRNESLAKSGYLADLLAGSPSMTLAFHAGKTREVSSCLDEYREKYKLCELSLTFMPSLI